MSRYNRDENRPAIARAIETLAKSTEASYTAINQVKDAFSLGLWYKVFPDYMVENLDKLYSWDLEKVDPAAAESYNTIPGHKFQFISLTGDSWHQCYRDLRNLGWKRLNVHRDGGRLQYLLKVEDEDKPEGFRELHLLLDISISTCKQVQVGTEMKEVPVMKTVCEDLVEIVEAGDEEPLRHLQMSGICMPGCPKCAAEAEVVVYDGQVDIVAEVNGETFVADKTHEAEAAAEQIATHNSKDDIPF